MTLTWEVIDVFEVTLCFLVQYNPGEHFPEASPKPTSLWPQATVIPLTARAKASQPPMSCLAMLRKRPQKMNSASLEATQYGSPSLNEASAKRTLIRVLGLARPYQFSLSGARQMQDL